MPLALLFALAVTLGAGHPPEEPGASARGCSSRPAGTADGLPDGGLAVDGEIVALYSMDEPPDVAHLMPDVDRVRTVEIVCWAAAERIFGAKVRSGIVSVWTYDAFADGRDFLRNAYAHVGVGGSLSELAPPHPELVLARAEIEGGEGFHLELTHPRRRWRCWVSSVAEIHSARDSSRGRRMELEPGTPRCASLHDHGGSGQ
jgi:hypothetical protein